MLHLLYVHFLNHCEQVNIGTTHFVNAVVQQKHLSRVSVIRLCGPASRAVLPFSDFPPTLKDVIFGSSHFVNGGNR
jgi:N-methylhydantoinase A/oxoprolinase/acetone carboxylase beta subunit